MKKNSKTQRKSSIMRGKKGIKVTYISSPMKVNTSASNFRALVQELTGKYSNVAEALVEEARENGDELGMKGSSAHEQQWRRRVESEPEEEEETASLKFPDSSSLMMEPILNDQLLWDFLSFDVM